MAVKLPLAVRKNLRDDYESKVDELQARLKSTLGEDYTLEPSIDALYAVAEDRGSQLGSILYSYFDNAIDGINYLTKKGADKEAVDLFNSLVPNRKFIIHIDKDAGFNYCGPRFRDGDFDLVINPDAVWTNVSNITENLDRKVDLTLFNTKGQLGLGVSRGVKEYLDPALKRAGDKYKKMFGKEYSFEYDLLGVYKQIHAKAASQDRFDEDGWYWNYGSSYVPNMISKYFEESADGLEYKGFGKDDMLQEAFVESTPAGVVAFQLVDALPSGYHQAKFEDDKFVIATTAENFGVNIGSDIVEKVIDLL